MKMDLAGPGGARAHGVATCQSQPSDIWEQLRAKGGRELQWRVQFHNIIMLYHNPWLAVHKINASAGSYHSCCLGLMVTVNYSFHFIDLRRNSCWQSWQCRLTDTESILTDSGSGVVGKWEKKSSPRIYFKLLCLGKKLSVILGRGGKIQWIISWFSVFINGQDMNATLCQRFYPCKALELIRVRLQPAFVWKDRWVLRSLPLAAVAGITGQALMGGGITSC